MNDIIKTLIHMLDNFLQRIRWSNVMRRLCAAAAVKGKARIDLMIYRIMEMVGDFFLCTRMRYLICEGVYPVYILY